MDSITEPTNCDVAETAGKLSESIHQQLLWKDRVQMALGLTRNTSECTTALSDRCAVCPWPASRPTEARK